ncbi:hypothetical protein C3K47_11085 [Solitalea longa]|uniref:DUF4878 domain-containing protein n=1 Tax=Solitalea longa TaxID=2079460 RepID=A0A2S5A204_9SPHI|nr:hypothetical protein [Solitalea longa]POY36292.1 hypothetical protein C3K47_11085 [Solitalea longa]
MKKVLLGLLFTVFSITVFGQTKQLQSKKEIDSFCQTFLTHLKANDVQNATNYLMNYWIEHGTEKQRSKQSFVAYLQNITKENGRVISYKYVGEKLDLDVLRRSYNLSFKNKLVEITIWFNKTQKGWTVHGFNG